MPTPHDLTTAFNALVDTALDFIETSVVDLETAPKLSVVHFATGLELLLKARLFSEHWALIAENPRKATWSALSQGHVKTVGASELCAAVSAISGSQLGSQEKAFNSVFTHRNRALHFMLVGDKAQIAAEQLTAWYHLHMLLGSAWSPVFAAYQTRIAAVESKLMRNRKYLQVRFRQLKSILAGKSKAGVIIGCPSCTFLAAELASATSVAPAVACHVCKSNFSAVNFGCSNWSIVGDGQTNFECKCGSTHDIDDLVAKLDATAHLSPKESVVHGPGVYHCGTCLDPEARVVDVDGEMVCLGCGERFGRRGVSSCEWCNELWVGYDTEDSYLTGCEFCSGHDPD